MHHQLVTHQTQHIQVAAIALQVGADLLVEHQVDVIQALLVNLAKDMAAKGEITLTKNRADDELVY